MTTIGRRRRNKAFWSTPAEEPEPPSGNAWELDDDATAWHLDDGAAEWELDA